MPSNNGHGGPGNTIIAETYDYEDAGGKSLFQVVRMVPKDFRQRRRGSDGAWVWNVKGIQLVLYRLPKILAAPLEQTVYLVEGEKDVHELERLELLATTNPQGAGKWRPQYTETLRGRKVVILPDNDEPGRQHAENVLKTLKAIAADVRIVYLPGLQPKGDVSDWIAGGGTAARLQELIDAPPDAPPPPEETWLSPPEILAQMAKQGDAIPTKFAPIDRACRGGGLRTRRIISIAGPPEAGKTMLVCQILNELAPFYTIACLFADEGWESAAVKLGQQLGWDREKLEASDEGTLLKFIQQIEGMKVIFENPQAPGMCVQRLVETLERIDPDDSKPRILVIDSAQRVRTFPESDVEGDPRREVMELMVYLREIVQSKNLLVILTSQVHRGFYQSKEATKKAAGIASGAESRSIEFESDIYLVLDRPNEEGLGRCMLEKNRLRSGSSVPFMIRIDHGRAKLIEIDPEAAEQETQARQNAELRKLIAKVKGRVLDILKVHQPLTGRQVRDVVKGRRDLVIDALNELEREGKIGGSPGPRGGIQWRIVSP
jgi:RecA/RadA recombinase